MIMGNADRPDLGLQLTDSFCTVDPEIARHFARVTFLSDNRRDFRRGAHADRSCCSARTTSSRPTSVGRYVHEQIPNSRFVQLSATGHCPNLSAPDELADAIRSFLR